MAYMCKYSNRECDSCGACVDYVAKTCPNCGEILNLDDIVFVCNGEIVCCEYCCTEEKLYDVVESGD